MPKIIGRPPAYEGELTKTITVSVPNTLGDLLDDQAKNSDTSRSKMIVAILAAHLRDSGSYPTNAFLRSI